MLHFYTHWKRQKTEGFLKFQGVWKWNIGVKYIDLLNVFKVNNQNTRTTSTDLLVDFKHVFALRKCFPQIRQNILQQ